MIYEGVELHNVAELLTGDVHQVLDEAALNWLREGNPADHATYLQQGPGGLWLTRVPDPLRRQLNPLAHVNALQATGCEMRFNLQSGEARMTLQSVLRPSIVEVYQGPFLVGWHVIATAPTEVVIALPPNQATLERLAQQENLPWDARLTRLLLPWRPPVRLLGIEGLCEPPQAGQTPSRRLLCYGSSITHGNTSVRPSATYASRLAQLLGVDLINLGFGGGAHLEPQMADYIASRQDWDVATLEMGINMLGAFTAEEFARRVRYMLSAVGGAHPQQHILAIDLYTCSYDLERGPKIGAFRRAVRQAVRELDHPHLVHVSGRRLLASFGGLTADLVHPSPAGMEEIARNLARTIRRRARL